MNQSSAYDVCLLALEAMKNEKFAQICSTKIHYCYAREEDGTLKEMVWENTNKLLRERGFLGVKTG